MKFSLDGRVYDAASLYEVTLQDILVFEAQLWQLGGGAPMMCLGEPVTWQRIIGWADLDSETLGADESFWLFAVMVWASRRAAGDKVAFADAVDFAFDDVKWLPEPEDHKPAGNPTSARTGSGRAAKPRTVAAVASPPPNSEPTSATG